MLEFMCGLLEVSFLCVLDFGGGVLGRGVRGNFFDVFVLVEGLELFLFYGLWDVLDLFLVLCYRF